MGLLSKVITIFFTFSVVSLTCCFSRAIFLTCITPAAQRVVYGLLQIKHAASQALRKIPLFHLISLLGNFVERRSFRMVGNCVETVPFYKTSTPEN